MGNRQCYVLYAEDRMKCNTLKRNAAQKIGDAFMSANVIGYDGGVEFYALLTIIETLGKEVSLVIYDEHYDDNPAASFSRKFKGKLYITMGKEGWNKLPSDHKQDLHDIGTVICYSSDCSPSNMAEMTIEAIKDN